MSTIVTRSGKGSPLTHTEVDNNFTNLNTDKLQSGDTAASLVITSADINGGTIDGATIGASSASTGAFTTATASTSFASPVFKATSSAGGALQNSSGTNQLQWGGGGGNNLSVDVAININPANAQVAISPTGTGSVTINPATSGTINNMSIGASTASTGAFTSLTDSGNLTFTGTGNRITGDMSNATHANRIAFQTSTTDGATSPFILPNGTGTTASIVVANASNPTNSAFGQLRVTSSSADILSGTIGSGTALPLTMYTGGSEKLRIDTSGNVGIGTSSPGSARLAIDSGAGALMATFNSTNASGGYSAWATSGTVIADIGTAQSCFGTGGSDTFAINGRGARSLLFGTSNTERMRIDSSGNLLVRTTSQISPGGVSGVSNMLNPNNDGGWALALQNNATTGGNGRGIGIRNATDFNTSSNEFIYCVGNATARFFVASNGGIANYSANNSNLSDERTKTDIVDAGNYLTKICAIPVRTFKYKDQSDDLLNLGVIAQEVEAVAPELVNVSGFGETPEDGIPLKAIYQTDLQYALMKCIQEQQAIITDLKSRIESLENK